MSPFFSRSDIHQAALAACSLGLRDRSIVFAEAKGGNEQSCIQALEAQIRREQRDRGIAHISVPKAVLESDCAPSWRASALDAAGKAGVERTLPVRLPELLALVGSDARAAEGNLGLVRAQFQTLDRERKALEQRRDFFRKVPPSRADLQRLVRWLHIGKVTAILGETAAILSAVAARLGIGTGLPLALVPPTAWFTLVGVGAVGTIAVLGAPFGSYFLARKLGLGRGAIWAAFVLSLFATIGLALLLGGVRAVGGIGVAGLTASLAAMSGSALMAVAVAGGCILSLLAVLAHHIGREAADRLHVIDHEEQAFARQLAEVGDSITRCEEDIAAFANSARLPAVLRASFEQAVQSAESTLRGNEEEREARVSRAMGVYHQLATLSEAEIEQVAAQVILLERKREDDEGGGGGLLGAVGALLLAVNFLSGCGATGDLPTTSVFVGCDASGASVEDVCTPDLLHRAAESWIDGALGSPGSMFRVIASGGDYATTGVHPPVVVPLVWGDDPPARIAAWRQESLAYVHGIPVGVDAPARENRSDLLSLIAIAARLARESSTGAVHFTLASDGRFISLGYNTERDIPKASAVLARLAGNGVEWDLSGFASVTLCGLHNVATTASAADAREDLLRDLVRAGNGPEPRIRSSCRDLYVGNGTVGMPAATDTSKEGA